MKVLLINGSSREAGSTAAALGEVAKALEAEGVMTETVFIGNKPIADCLACGKCRELKKCVINDIVNEITEKARECDGFVFGSPVYYAHPSARLLAVMDRAFYSGKDAFMFKPAAAVTVARRAGTTASMDVINKYFTISSMPVVSSTYWNQAFNCGGDIAQDIEGVQTMQNIGKNMSWLIKCIKLAEANGITHPVNDKTTTNFIR